jgi:hypothetical protein
MTRKHWIKFVSEYTRKCAVGTWMLSNKQSTKFKKKSLDFFGFSNKNGL